MRPRAFACRRYVIGALTLWMTAVSAADRPKMALSLQQAVDMALAPSGAERLQLAHEAIRQYEAQRRQTLSALLPNVDGTWTVSSFTRNLQAFGISASGAGIPFQIPRFVGPIENYDLRATGSITIFDWASIRRLQASSARLKAATADEQAEKNKTVADVIRAYTAAQRAHQLVSTANADVELAERILSQARNQKESGTGTGIDITRAQVQLARQRESLVSARQEETSANLSLLRVLNAGLNADVSLTDPLTYVPAEIPEPDAAVAVGQQKRPELKAQALREKGSRLSYESVASERLPSAQLYGDYGTIGTSYNQGLPTRVVGVRVNLPVFDGGKRDARRMETASQLRQEKIRSRDTSQQVELEVRQAVEALRTAEEMVKVATEAQDLSERELEQAQRRYENGVATSVEVTDAQTRVSQAREQKVTALYQQRSARAELNLATGEIEKALQ